MTNSIRFPSKLSVTSLPVMKKSFYLPQLDGLRFIAFLLVFCNHTPYFPSALTPLNHYGWIGVDLFLCLSAYLITRLLVLEYQETGRISISSFFIRRSLRIWPLYHLALILGFFIFPLLNLFGQEIQSPLYPQILKDHLIPYLFFLGNWSSAYFSYPPSTILAPLWTISLEEQFYLACPMLMSILLPKPRHLKHVLLCLLLFSIVCRYYLYLHRAPHIIIWVSTFSRLDSLIVGIWVAINSNYLARLISQPNKTLKIFLSGSFLLLLTAHFPNIQQGTPHTIWIYFAFAVALGCFLIVATGKNLFSKFLSLSPLVFLGKISYGLYVFHNIGMSIQYQCVAYLNLHFSKNFPNLGWIVSSWPFRFSFSLLITIGIGVLSYFFYERHFLRLKTRFTTIASRPV